MNLGQRFISLGLAAATLTLAVPACTSAPAKTERQAGRPTPPPSPLTLSIAPATDAKDLPISAEIETTVSGGKVTDVTVTDERGSRVSGAMRADGTGWLPDRALDHRRTYDVRVTAQGDGGQTITRNTRFSTMGKPQKQTMSTLYFDSGRTYGVAMPVSVAFEPAIPERARAQVQRRLFVNSDPPQPGVWRWTADGRQVDFRPRDFWRPGTTVTVRAALAGVPLGAGAYLDADRTASSKIGRRVFLDVDNATKHMSVYQDDQLVRRIPVSLGKPSTPSSSGRMVIMEKFDTTVFDTRGEPDGGYVVTVQDAQRTTWGGEFIHAAPWSEGDQGNTNVSHGCTNVSSANADWLMKVTQVGDLVTVTGTEVQLRDGNGWTVWNHSWEEFIKGSALPVPEDLRTAPPGAGVPPGATPSPGATGTAPGGSAAPTGPSAPPASPAPSPEATPTATDQSAAPVPSVSRG